MMMEKKLKVGGRATAEEVIAMSIATFQAGTAERR
jgi:hypothetical protein